MLVLTKSTVVHLTIHQHFSSLSSKKDQIFTLRPSTLINTGTWINTMAHRSTPWHTNQQITIAQSVWPVAWIGQYIGATIVHTETKCNRQSRSCFKTKSDIKKTSRFSVSVIDTNLHQGHRNISSMQRSSNSKFKIVVSY